MFYVFVRSMMSNSPIVTFPLVITSICCSFAYYGDYRHITLAYRDLCVLTLLLDLQQIDKPRYT
jgi:hypothetical protein